MENYHAAYWSSDPFRLSSSEEEEETHYNVFLSIFFLHRVDNEDGFLAFLNPNKKDRLKVYKHPCSKMAGPEEQQLKEDIYQQLQW